MCSRPSTSVACRGKPFTYTQTSTSCSVLRTMTCLPMSRDVNKDWTCKDKDKDQAYKDKDKD